MPDDDPEPGRLTPEESEAQELTTKEVFDLETPSQFGASKNHQGQTHTRCGFESLIESNFQAMANQVEAISVLVALAFVVMSAVVILLVPLEVAAPLIPLLLVFLVALQMYRS